jgi:hypothetical protein
VVSYICAHKTICVLSLTSAVSNVLKMFSQEKDKKAEYRASTRMSIPPQII